MIISVDFDGTIVEHRYPAIGKERPFATATLRRLMQDGHKLILFSVREGQLLEDAIMWCEERGVRFYSANADIDEDAGAHQGVANFTRKIKADIFIDDRNIGGIPDWGVIYQLISRHLTYDQYLNEEQHSLTSTPSKKWWKFW